MSRNNMFRGMLVLLLGGLAACTATPVEPSDANATPAGLPTPAAETPQPMDDSDAAVTAATTQLASELGVAASDITVVSAEKTEFMDSCLGLGQANESCLQAITPGWIVVLDVNGQDYEVHTDEAGQQARVAMNAGSGVAAEPEAATATSVAYLAEALGVAETDIEVVALEAADFPDSCLGLGQANESCLQAITPGWLVTLGVGGAVYELHTDEIGGQVRLASPSS